MDSLVIKSIAATSESFMICPPVAEEFDYKFRSGNTFVKIGIVNKSGILLSKQLAAKTVAIYG